MPDPGEKQYFLYELPLCDPANDVLRMPIANQVAMFISSSYILGQTIWGELRTAAGSLNVKRNSDDTEVYWTTVADLCGNREYFHRICNALLHEVKLTKN